MTRSLRNKLLITISALLCIIIGIFTCTFILGNADVPTVPDLKTEYQLDEEITIPEYHFVENGTMIPATEYILEYPNGLMKSGRTHTLDVAGVYTISYSATSNGRVYTEEASFVVINKLYTFENEKSSIYYGVNENYKNAPEGLVLSVAAGDEISFNQIIDLSDKTKVDRLLSFYITPLESGTFDAANITIRFTDAYDPDNYMDIIFKCLYGIRPWAKELTYTVAQTPGNPTVGGTHVGNMWGWTSYQTFCGVEMWGHKVGEDPYNVHFDYATKQVWLQAKHPAKGFEGTYVADLDDPTIFTNPWKGFTTGEVYMSVFASSFNSPSANLVITELAGYDLTQTDFVDTTAPVLTVDLEGNEIAPNGLKNQPYKIFKAMALDSYDGSLNVETGVYYKYGTPGQINVYTKDGYFYPNRVGTHTIVYTASDSYGNKAVKLVEVNVESEYEIDFEIIGSVAEGISGVNIQALKGVEIENAKGSINIYGTATLGEDVLPLDENYSFRPLKAGTYRVQITVADYIETLTKEFDIIVTANTELVFVEEAKIVPYFINGQAYELPAYNGYDLSSGNPEAINARIFICEDFGEEKEVGTEPFTVNAKEKISIIYKISSGDKMATSVYERKVVDAINEEGNVDMAKYYDIIQGSGNVTMDKDYVRFSTTEDSTAMFANAVQVEDFIAKFRWSETKTAFEGINIYFTDKNDSSIRIKITYTWVNELGYIAINDGETLQVPLNVTSSDRTSLTLGYINADKQVYGHTSLKMNVMHTLSGEEFNGFPSNMAYIEFEIFGVSGEAELCIAKINNQAMCDLQSEDFMMPELFTKRSNGDVALNTIIPIYGARVYDVLSNSVKLTLAVRGPDGQYLTALDGTVLNTSCNPYMDYEIKATQYGKYSITFVATDEAGNTNRYSYGFEAIDMGAPTIIVDTSTIKAELGKVITVKGYSASDNITSPAQLKVSIYVLRPGYIMELVTDSKINLDEKGTYTVYYYCYDELNNIVVTSYKILVD